MFLLRTPMVPVASWPSLPPMLACNQCPGPWKIAPLPADLYFKWSPSSPPSCWPPFYFCKTPSLSFASYLLVPLLFLNCQVSSLCHYTLCLSVKSSLESLFKERVHSAHLVTLHRSPHLTCAYLQLPVSRSTKDKARQGKKLRYHLFSCNSYLNRELCLEMQDTGPDVPGSI